MIRISSFKGEYRFLSNFWMVPVLFVDGWYPSVEHAYQAAKTLDVAEKALIKNAPTAAEAKRLGKHVKVCPDWEGLKVPYMRFLVWFKFAKYPDLGRMLLDTGNAELIEGNTWNDTFWGVCRGLGENQLGKILMEVRDHVRGAGPAKEAPKQVKPVDKVFEPRPGHIFVFGSNLAGVHGAGAALTAKQKYGAKMGIGEGLKGTSYALPTKDHNIQTLSLAEIKKHVDRFILFAWERSDLTFFVTRIGCGLAGYTDEAIGPLFEDAPPNCDLPHGWGKEIE